MSVVSGGKLLAGCNNQSATTITLLLLLSLLPLFFNDVHAGARSGVCRREGWLRRCNVVFDWCVAVVCCQGQQHIQHTAPIIHSHISLLLITIIVTVAVWCVVVVLHVVAVAVVLRILLEIRGSYVFVYDITGILV